jgi:hypothetical protein
METYWSSKKNSIQEMLKDPVNINSALVPFIKEKCPKWREREGRRGYILLIKGGKPDRV